MLIFEPSILHYYYTWHNLKFGMLNNQYSMCVVLLCSNCVARAFSPQAVVSVIPCIPTPGVAMEQGEGVERPNNSHIKGGRALVFVALCGL